MILPCINLEKLRTTFNEAVSTTCKVRSCELDLLKFPESKLILKIDSIPEIDRGGKKSDYAISVNSGDGAFFLPIEFKSSNPKVSDAVEQLQSAVDFFKSHLPNGVNYYPVLVSGHIKTLERRILSKSRINCPSGKKVGIRHVRCGKMIKWDDVKNTATKVNSRY